MANKCLLDVLTGLSGRIMAERCDCWLCVNERAALSKAALEDLPTLLEGHGDCLEYLDMMEEFNEGAL
jgi:hypothetical protein